MSDQENPHRLNLSVSGEGPAIIFVHGNASTRDIWKDVIPCLSDQFSCFSYDLRGHGQGPGLTNQLTLEQLVKDLEQVRAETGHDQVALVGHSLGAFIVAKYAHQFPERVVWSSLLAMPAGRTDADQAAAEELLKRLKNDGVGTTVPHLVHLWYTQAFVAAHPGYLQRRLEQLQEIDERIFIAFYELYSRNNVDKILPDLLQPTLVMTGEFARGAGSETACFIASQLPSAELKIFPEVKNGLMTEIPQKVGNALMHFAGQHQQPE